MSAGQPPTQTPARWRVYGVITGLFATVAASDASPGDARPNQTSPDQARAGPATQPPTDAAATGTP